MTTIKIFLAAIFCLSVTIVAAQQNISKGKITTATSTFEGYISSTELDETPQEFKISEKKDGPFRAVTEQVLRVELANGEVFERHTIKVSTINKNYLDREKEDYNNPSSKDVLVQKLLSGAISMYLFKDEFTYPHYFYKTASDNVLVLLVNQPYVGANDTLHEDNSFRNQLKYLAATNNCEKIAPRAMNVNYDVNKLVGIAASINKCAGSSSTYDYRKLKKFEVGIEVAGGYTRLSPKKLENTKSSSNGFVVGGTVKFSKPGKSSLYFFADIFYYHLLIDNLYTSPNQTFPYSDHYKENRNTIYFAPGARIYVGERKIRPYFEGGFALLSLRKSKIDREEILNNGSSRVSNSESSRFGFDGKVFAGIGIGSNRVSGLARMEFDLDRGGYFASAILRVSVFNR